jgi:hypothetical protein
MERLTAFEFIGASNAPQLVRLRHANGTVLAQFGFVQWIGIDLRALTPDGLPFEQRADLVIEGEGLGHPYWNDDCPSWVATFDSRTEAQRIETIRAAVMREINRARIAQC